MPSVYYNPNRLEGFLLFCTEFPPQKMLDVAKHPDRFDLKTQRQQKRYLLALFRAAFVKPAQSVPDFRGFKRFLFSLSRRLFTLFYSDYACACAIDILKDHLNVPTEKNNDTTRQPASTNKKHWEKELQTGAKRISKRWSFEKHDIWKDIVANYPAHAPFTDETALHLSLLYLQHLEKSDSEEREKVKKAIHHYREGSA